MYFCVLFITDNQEKFRLGLGLVTLSSLTDPVAGKFSWPCHVMEIPILCMLYKYKYMYQMMVGILC